MTLVHASYQEIERWLDMQRPVRVANRRLFSEVMTMLSTIEIVDATLPLLDAALAGSPLLPTSLNAAIAPSWEGFPEALPVLRDNLARDPGTQWGTAFFVLTSPRTLVGMGGFKGPPRDGVVEIGYAIAPSFQGRGLATEAARQLVTRAFADTRVTAVDAHTLGEANASTRVLEKLGLTRIGEANDPDHGSIWHWRLTRIR